MKKIINNPRANELIQDYDSKDIAKLIANIKKDILSTRNRILNDANKELIHLYFRIGKVISENQKYGTNFVNKLSISLKIDYPDVVGFSPRNLARMKKFYEAYLDLSNLPTALAKLPWSFNCLLIDKISEISIRTWYGEKSLLEGWSYVVLSHQIDSHLYERQAHNDKKQNNFMSLLPNGQNQLAVSLLKDPYVFELNGLSNKIIEADIEKAIIEKIKNVLLELGKGFSFVGNQYRISTRLKDYYIDLLFYHLDLRCFVVVELKNTDFDPSFIGQLQFYVTAVDETLKKVDDQPTIGLLLCKNKDRDSVDWSLKATSVPIGIASFKINEYLPTEEEINLYLK